MTNDERDMKAIYDVINGPARNAIFASDILPLLQAVRAEYAGHVCPTPLGPTIDYEFPLKVMVGDDGRFHATHCELPPLHDGACGTLASKRPTAQEMMSEEDRAAWMDGWHYCLHGYRVNPKCGPCFTGADVARWEGER